MDNAAKALIIAGAILLSILIIALGVTIFSNAQSGISDSLARMDQNTKEAFNSQFSQLEGENVKGIKVKELIRTLRQNAATNIDDAAKRPSYEIDGEKADSKDNDYADKLDTINAKIKNNKTYSITITKHNKAGIVSEIVVKPTN